MRWMASDIYSFKNWVDSDFFFFYVTETQFAGSKQEIWMFLLSSPIEVSWSLTWPKSWLLGFYPSNLSFTSQVCFLSAHSTEAPLCVCEYAVYIYCRNWLSCWMKRSWAAFQFWFSQTSRTCWRPPRPPRSQRVSTCTPSGTECGRSSPAPPSPGRGFRSVPAASSSSVSSSQAHHSLTFLIRFYIYLVSRFTFWLQFRFS